jgi:hypothetical protein
LVIGEASVGPELVDGIEERGGRRHPLLRRGAESVFDFLIEESLFGKIEPKTPLRDRLISFHGNSPLSS